MLMIFCHTHHVQNYFVTNNNILGLIKVHSSLNIERALCLFPDRRLSDCRYPDLAFIPTKAQIYTLSPTITTIPTITQSYIQSHQETTKNILFGNNCSAINIIFNFKGTFSEQKRLTSLNLSGTYLVLDTLAVLHLNI